MVGTSALDVSGHANVHNMIGYPEADEAPSKFFLLKTDEAFDDVFDRSLLFLKKLFIVVNREVKFFPLRRIQDGKRNRRRIYKKVVNKSEVNHKLSLIGIVLIL
jgi:hypothetical protein